MNVTEYMCHKLPRICSVFVIITIRSFPHSCFIIELMSRVTRPVSLVEQELITLPEHLSSPSVIGWGSRCSIFSFLRMCCKSLFVLLYFFLWPLCCLSFYYLRVLTTPLVSYCHCAVYHSTIYGFWLPLWYLVAIVLSIILLSTDSDYPFDILWPLCSLSFYYLRILITPLVSLSLSYDICLQHSVHD